MASNLIFFLAGLLSTFIFLWYYSSNSEEKPTVPRKWSKIRNLDFKWEFDQAFNNPITISNIVNAVTQGMREEMKSRKSEDLASIVVGPGNYTVKIRVDCAFIQREEEDSANVK